MWSCFCHTTTLPGLVQICTSKSKAAQLFWLAMLLAGACITAEQSYRIVQQYLRFGVVEKRYKELEISAVMPTVTVCSNFLLNPQEQLGNTLWMSALEEIQLTPGKPNIYREQRFTKIITSYLKDLPMDERIKAGYRFSDVILECKYGAEKCKSTGVFHSLVYGNCFSLNSPSAKQGVTTFEVLEMILNSPLNIFSNSSAYVGPVAIIHEPNTAPAVQPYNAIYIYPRKWLSIKFQRSEFYRLKSPYASHCVDGDDEEARRQSYYYTETTPYEYSWEACTRTCLQRESYLRCRCYAKSIPSPANVNSTGAKLCGGDICSKLADMSVEFCNCPPRCKEITYSRTVEIDAQRFEDGDIKVSQAALNYMTSELAPKLI